MNPDIREYIRWIYIPPATKLPPEVAPMRYSAIPKSMRSKGNVFNYKDFSGWWEQESNKGDK